ncbi:ribosomal protein L7/L12 [Acinetobacter guillouiae]|uniref:ribosomal protein L7/L12 n=1 Tax=Acinetobacter guillouiae TaxID=106649 RepID=UPI001D18ECAE|nr:ribosomal protein L7/L12 [Acinetobacter guillouiae]
MMPNFNPQQRQEILLLIQQGRKVEAVKWVKDHSDLGLKEAKDYVENLTENAYNFAFADTAQSDSSRDIHLQIPQQDIHALIQQNRKIEAIKLVMENSNLGLKDAKDFVEQLTENPNLAINQFQFDDDFYDSQHPRYKAIQSNFETGEIYVLYQDHQKVLIDEHHPDWDEIMRHFSQGETYDSAAAYIAAMKAKARDSAVNSTHNVQSIPRPSSMTTQPVGIEDQTKKKGLPIVMLVVIAIVAVIAYQFFIKQ